MRKHSKLDLAVNADYGIHEQSEKIPKTSNQKVFVVKNTETLVWKKLINGDEAALGELYNIYI